MLQTFVTEPENVREFLQKVFTRVNGVLAGSLKGRVVNVSTFIPTSDEYRYLVFTDQVCFNIVIHTNTDHWKIQAGPTMETLCLACEFSTGKLVHDLGGLQKQYRRLFQQRLRNLPRSGDPKTDVSKLMLAVFGEAPLAGLE